MLEALALEGLMELFFRLYKKEFNSLTQGLTKLFLKSFKEASCSSEEFKELILDLYKEKHNLSEEELLEFRQCYNDEEIEAIVVEIAAHYDLLPVIKYFIENGGNPYFVIEEGTEKFTILNVAANKGCLDIINYLLDNNVFTVDQRISENSKTPFHSAVEGNNIEAVKLLLQRGADINAKFMFPPLNAKMTVWFYIIFGFYNNFIYDKTNMKMVELFVKQDICMPDENSLGFNDMSQEIRSFVLSIKRLEDLYLYPTDQDSDFVDAYNFLSLEVQEIWDVRVSRYRLSKLAEFIEKKFNREIIVIGYKEYAVLREYSSLPKHKKEALEILLAQKNFNSDDLIKVDNYIKAHFFKIALIGLNLVGSAFEAIAKAEIIGEITQYLHFEDSSIKVAGVSSGDIDCNHS